MNKSSIRGFTLIEAIITIVITGILAGMVAVFIKAPVEGYVDTVRRADLTDAADGALRRIARDVRTALPNSLRGSSNSCFEFLPVVAAGRYRNAAGATTNAFNFTTPDSFDFDVLANNNLTNLPSGQNNVVVYNLGIAGADAYAGDNRRAIASINGPTDSLPETTVSMDAGIQFPFESPGKRFHVIPDYSVIYSCDTEKLRRFIRPISVAALTACPVSTGTLENSVLVSNVVDCSFTYTGAVSQRNGQLTMRLKLEKSGESVQLYQEVNVDNLP